MTEFGNDLTFYLNFVVLNASEVVSNTIKEKFGDSSLGNAASSAIAKVIDANAKVTEKVGEELTSSISKTTKEMGLDVTIKTVFKQGPLIVFRITINGGDPVTIVRSAKGDEAGKALEKISRAMDVIGVDNKMLEGKIFPQVKMAMMENLTTQIPKKIREKSELNTICFTNEPADEANWLFAFLEKMPPSSAAAVPRSGPKSVGDENGNDMEQMRAYVLIALLAILTFFMSK